ncbi:hypothetical protein DYD21_09500 [Rhodohalobacter sp. SW132]|nr:hypothetical protein DYD21_09500 [Rhodohalobacter sp. SW132]
MNCISVILFIHGIAVQINPLIFADNIGHIRVTPRYTQRNLRNPKLSMILTSVNKPVSNVGKWIMHST